MLDIGSALAFPFRGPRWRERLLVAVVLALIPFLGLFLLGGYTMRVARRVSRGEDEELPPWDDWGDLLTDSLRSLAIPLVWFLPFILIFCCAFLLILQGITGDPRAQDLGVVIFVLAVVVLPILIFAAVVSFFLPAALGRGAAMESFDAGIEFGAVWRLVRANAAIYLAILLAEFGVNLFSSLLQIAPLVATTLISAYLTPVQGYLYGQGFRIASSADQMPAEPETVSDRWLGIDVVTPINEIFAGGWPRRLLGAALLVVVPVVGWIALLGYASRLVRRARAGLLAPRPDWGDWRELAADGSRAALVLAIWGLPLWLLAGLEARVVAAWRRGDFDALGQSGLMPFGIPGVPDTDGRSVWSILLPEFFNFGVAALLWSLAVLSLALLPALLGRVAIERSLLAGIDVPDAVELIRNRPIAYATVVAIELGSISLRGACLVFLGIGALMAAGFAVMLCADLTGQLFREVVPAVEPQLDAGEPAA